ncbi:MAG: hypothetical protein S4CHLAM45_15140 [Chlamydiales bacterium]|nr:hypothetical protein [Chlamydiales bacterium]MCH9620131.1 hypothetical protein [Chlamydiales bacterium]MCH9623601.1 hypothetical protein [Chlamydiales bacterium]
MVVQVKNEKVISSVQSFVMFLHLAQKNKQLSLQVSKSMEKKVLKIIEQLTAKSIDSAAAIATINKVIEETNQHLKQIVYPLLVNRTPFDFMRNEVVAFEVFVNQQMNRGNLKLEEEKELFNGAVAIWEDIGHVAQSVTLSQFQDLVKKGNKYLLEGDHYPTPHPKEFPVIGKELDKEVVAPHITRKKHTPPGEAK